ncbi:MAG: ABC transporter ATP-binding protein [Cellulosilyticaceae bacterium]
MKEKGNCKDGFPSSLAERLEKSGIREDQVIAYVKSDLEETGAFGEAWIVLTKEQLWVNERRTYALEGLGKLRCEQFVSSGVLIQSHDDKDELICQFSNSELRQMTKFVKIVEGIKEGKLLEELVEEEEEVFCPKCHMRYEDANRKICYRCIDKRMISKRLFGYLPKYKMQIGAVLICMFFSSLLNMAIPYLTGNIFFDKVLAQDVISMKNVAICVGLMIGARVLSTGIGIAYGRINSVFSAKVVYDIKNQIFEALQRLSLSFYSNKQTGGLMNHVNEDSTHLQYFFHDQAPFFIVNAITIIGVLGVMFKLEWKLTLMTLLPIPLVVYGLYKLFPKMMLTYTRRFKKSSALNAIINDALNGVRVVKAFGKEEEEVGRFNKASEGLYDVNVWQGNLIETAYPLINFVMGLSTLVIWGYGSWLVVSGDMTFGTLITFTGYIGMLLGPLQFMTRITQMWSDCLNSASRIFEIMDITPEIMEVQNPVKLPEMKGSVSLANVNFEYETNKPILKDITMDVQAGEMIGIVGHSGAGKSTLTNIITRLYDVQSGDIAIDGVPLKDIKLEDLRSQIGIVLQETTLFIGSLAQNIAYARPEATMDEIIAAAKVANAHDFITKLPDGYDTMVGASGHRLSGGEKQRIAIARAILLDPKILILDEATASLDTETEKQIQEALENLIKGRTTFAIAHRLSTLRNADRLVVIEKGKIEEMGTHEELLANRSVYFNLVRKQQEALKLQGVS